MMGRMLCAIVISLLVIWGISMMFVAWSIMDAREYPDDEDPWD